MNIIEFPDNYKPKLSVKYPPFMIGDHIEEHFYYYNKKKESYLRTSLLGIFCKNILGYNYFNQDNYNRRNLQRQFNQLTNPQDLYCILHEDDDPIHHSKRLFIQVPDKTIIFGASYGDIPIPLLYDDGGLFESKERIPLEDKKYLCSFIGANTHRVRTKMQEYITGRADFYSSLDKWKEDVSIDKQNEFITVSLDSKFGLAPRGNGRGSFRFYELLKLGVIPIYIWDDIEWLPYKEYIDYSAFSISIHTDDIDRLESLLKSISNEKITLMIAEYQKVKHWFTPDGLCEYIIQKFESLEKKIGYEVLKTMSKKNIMEHMWDI
jgi:hypothetical protein